MKAGSVRAMALRQRRPPAPARHWQRERVHAELLQLLRVLSQREHVARAVVPAPLDPLLQQLEHIPEQLIVHRRALQTQNLFLQGPGGRDDVDARLEPTLNVARQLIHAGVRVHRHAQAEVRVRLHFDGRDGALDVAAVVHQRR